MPILKERLSGTTAVGKIRPGSKADRFVSKKKEKGLPQGAWDTFDTGSVEIYIWQELSTGVPVTCHGRMAAFNGATDSNIAILERTSMGGVMAFPSHLDGIPWFSFDGFQPGNALEPETASRSLLCLWHL